MKIIDTVSFFLQNYQPTITFLKEYYKRYPSVFHEYFSYHCKDTEERHDLSIKKYQDSWSSIQCVHDLINPLIQDVVQKYEEDIDHVGQILGVQKSYEKILKGVVRFRSEVQTFT
ncbi:MAG: hypothetical protein ACQET8_04875 [Bacillota bacterium]